jgi:hypothetical protein
MTDVNNKDEKYATDESHVKVSTAASTSNLLPTSNPLDDSSINDLAELTDMHTVGNEIEDDIHPHKKIKCVGVDIEENDNRSSI